MRHRVRVGRASSSVAILVAVALGAAACKSTPAYPDIEVDLSPMHLVPVAGASPPAALGAQQAVQLIELQRGPIRVVRVGRRWDGRQNVWVVVFRPHLDPGCARCWTAMTVSDQTGLLIAGFDAASLRAFGIDVPDW